MLRRLNMFYENASPEKVIENAFYRDWNIDEIKRSLSSQSIRAAVNKKRKCITAPHTSRKHSAVEVKVIISSSRKTFRQQMRHTKRR